MIDWTQMITSNGPLGMLIISLSVFGGRWLNRVESSLKTLVESNNRLNTATEVYKESLRHIERRLDDLED